MVTPKPVSKLCRHKGTPRKDVLPSKTGGGVPYAPLLALILMLYRSELNIEDPPEKYWPVCETRSVQALAFRITGSIPTEVGGYF